MTKTNFLFELPGIVFDVLIKRYTLDNIKNLELEWMGEKVLNARLVNLPLESAFEKPFLLYVDFQSKESRLIVLKNPPNCIFDIVLSEDLEIYSTLEVSKVEGPNENYPEYLEEGNEVNLALEFRSVNNGIVNITDANDRLCNMYSTEILNLGYSIYWKGKYLWYKEFFLTTRGNILPVQGAFVI